MSRNPDVRFRDPPKQLDIAEQVARVLCSLEETQKFVAEQKKLMAEAAKHPRDTAIAPFTLAITAFGAGAAMVAAVAAILKHLGP